jgi:hypothetical protein
MATEQKNTKAVPRSIGKFVTFIGKEILSQKKWVLFPVWVLLCVLALMLLIGGATTLLPAIYIAF